MFFPSSVEMSSLLDLYLERRSLLHTSILNDSFVGVLRRCCWSVFWGRCRVPLETQETGNGAPTVRLSSGTRFFNLTDDWEEFNTYERRSTIVVTCNANADKVRRRWNA